MSIDLDKNAQKLSVCWVVGWRNPEVIEAVKGIAIKWELITVSCCF